VNDGPLRRYDDQANQAFLEDINQGYVPHELEEEAQGQEVHVELADKKMEDFKEPEKPKYLAFGGSGYSMSSSSSSAAPVATPAPKKAVVIDESKPVTTIQIRLADGTRLVAKFNHDHTVLDIRSFIELAQKTTSAYDLVGGFPPKPLTDANQTIKEAGLLGAAVNQKMR
jgi:UBX domain-containing protein 1